MTSLISGVNGFIGRHLSDALLAKGHKVVGLNRELLTDPVALTAELEKIKPDYIFHLSAYGNHYDQIDEDQIIATNIISTYLLMKLAHLSTDFKAFINVSSSSTYGIKNAPMKETDSLDTDTFYGVSKVSAEGLARAFAKLHDLPMVSGVLFSIYGPGEADHRFIPTLINNGIKGVESKVSEGVHDWLYVEDAVDALILLAEKAGGLKGRRVNIGSGVQLGNHEISTLVSNLFFGGKLQINNVDKLRSFDSQLWVSDNTFLKSLGWEQKVLMGDGLAKTYEHYKQILKA